jgi:peptide/nickel transport system permease protein
MVTYIIRRLLWSVLLLFVVSFITFVMFILLPSADPAVLRAGRQPTPELIAAIRENLGLDKPWYHQYYVYMRELVLHFDFGYSYQNNISVRTTIFDRLPATISLAIGAAVVWLIVGISIGIISAIKRGTLMDRAAMGFALLAISAPVYWVGLVSIYLFSEDLGKLAPIFKGSGQYTPFTEDPIAWASALILPWLVLATAFAAIYARFLRANLLDVMGEDYIRTARAKGLGERRVVYRHALKNAAVPFLTVSGLSLGFMLSGTIVIETVFSWPGMGRLIVQAVPGRDFPVIQAAVFLFAILFVAVNLVVDVLQGLLDPRARVFEDAA